jgi:WD40 repeat protein
MHLAAAQPTAVSVLSVNGDTERHFDGSQWAVFHPDGSRLAVVHGDSVVIYDCATGQRRHTLSANSNAISACDFSPNGERLASTGPDSTVRIWNVSSGKQVGEPRHFTQQVNSLHYLGDGRLLVSQHNESLIIDSESRAEMARIPGGSHGADRMAISADDRLVASTTQDGTIRVWNLQTNEEECALRGHPPYLEGLSFTRDSNHLISVGSDSNIRIWELISPRESRVLSRARPFGGMAFSSDGHRLAIARNAAGLQREETDRVQILDAESGREILRLDGLGNPCFGPGDRWLATNRADGSVSLWDPQSGREIRKLAANGYPSIRIASNRDGSRLACGTFAGKILIWDLTRDAPPQIIGGHADLVTSLVFSRDGRMLASSDLHGTVLIWNEQFAEIKRWQIGSALQDMAFSPNSQLLAIAGESPAISVWDVAKGEEVHKFHAHKGGVTTLAFTPDGTRLVSGSVDETVRLWDVASGEEILSLAGVRGIVGYVAVSPDSHRIIACESVIRIWDND